MISVCIPTYEMGGVGKEKLKRSLDALKTQTYKDFEVVISDNSDDDEIKNLCVDNPDYASLSIRYFKNPRKGLAQNTNEAIKHATGIIIKILYMDDYLVNEQALERIKDNFTGHWLVTGCEHDDGTKRFHPYYPKYSKEIMLGKNTIGSPSVLAIKNDHPLLFDESMTWVLDCDYYQRMYDKYGEPVILNEINVIIGVGKHQMTNILTGTYKLKEHLKLIRKHKKGLFSWLKIW
jgi:glycosyltransferase involved in cell wall biosynthesis